jgi:hypothetical protein
MEISFRGVRNSFLNNSDDLDYTSAIHVITALSGALGMLHRSFWTDITLCLSDRYASYLGHLQYRLHRSPSTKLVMDLLQVQEELNIIIQIMEQQMALVTTLQDRFKHGRGRGQSHSSTRTTENRPTGSLPRMESIPLAGIATFRQLSFSHLSDPVSQLLENLQREYADLCDLRENSNSLINRTIQLVNIRLEDHGKAILVFTIVTIIFLPLSFVSSFFGSKYLNKAVNSPVTLLTFAVNFADIRDMESTQRLFWAVSGSLTVGVVGFAIFLAFYGSVIMEWFVTWKEHRSRRIRRPDPVQHVLHSHETGFRNFEILDSLRPAGTSTF